MTCKHNWHPSNFAIKHRAPNHYMYECQRCGKSIFATLKEKPTGLDGLEDMSAMNKRPLKELT